MCRNTRILKLSRYNIHVYYVGNSNTVFQFHRCPICGTFCIRTSNFERHFTTFSERVRNVYPRSLYHIRETLFGQLDSFGIKYTSEQKLLKKNKNIRLWIRLCPRRELKRHKYIDLDMEICQDICIPFFEPCGRTNCPLQPWSLSPRINFHWNSWKISFPGQGKSKKNVPWYRGNQKS